ncbi:RHOMBOID-like protein 12, mitochondrial [Cicer arietinum]|uniref:RHOMBOID-like protein 12, mitochondrial n=1 Tax=Cicer arietinum TaxID=3827 RepID=A0A1S2YR87_CICAR|nr:RHOMBOID-like protein 12, mitochondrial [Cicer arietinum]
MQSLVRRVTAVTRHHQHQPNLSFNSHTHRISYTRPQTHTHLRDHNISSFATHHFHSWRSLSTKIRASLSQPMIVQHFAFTSRISLSKTLLHRTLPRFLHFRPHSFNFNQNYHSYRRWRSWFFMLTPDNVVLVLIVANVAVFLFWRTANKNFMLNNFTISLDNIKSGRLHTLITNAFSHVNSGHLIFNMIGLYFFGVNIASNFGNEFLLKLYLAGAIGGAVFFLVHQAYKAQTSKGWRAINPSKELALGASGAVNAIMLLDIFLYPRATLYFYFVIPVPAALLGIFLIGKDMLRIIEGDSTISGSSHLGGVAVAAIAWAGIRKGRF